MTKWGDEQEQFGVMSSPHRAFGEVRTLCFIAIRINDDGTHQVVYSEMGGFNEAQAFLDMILADAGMK